MRRAGKRHDVDSAKIVAAGWSLGAAVRSGVVPMAIHSGHDIWAAHRGEVLRAVGQFVEKCCAGER